MIFWPYGYEDGHVMAMEYLEALMEWSLSIDKYFCIHPDLQLLWSAR